MVWFLVYYKLTLPFLPDIKTAINEKNIAFASKDKEKITQAQRNLDKKIREGKEDYKNKISQSFQSNNMKDVWGKMKSVINQDKTKTQMTVDDGQTYAQTTTHNSKQTT